MGDLQIAASISVLSPAPAIFPLSIFIHSTLPQICGADTKKQKKKQRERGKERHFQTCLVL